MVLAAALFAVAGMEGVACLYTYRIYVCDTWVCLNIEPYIGWKPPFFMAISSGKVNDSPMEWGSPNFQTILIKLCMGTLW